MFLQVLTLAPTRELAIQVSCVTFSLAICYFLRIYFCLKGYWFYICLDLPSNKLSAILGFKIVVHRDDLIGRCFLDWVVYLYKYFCRHSRNLKILKARNYPLHVFMVESDMTNKVKLIAIFKNWKSSMFHINAFIL